VRTWPSNLPLWIFGAALLGAAGDANACSGGAIPYDPPAVVRGLTPDQIAAMLPEVVVEGVVEGEMKPDRSLFTKPYDIGGETIWMGIDTVAAQMRIERVWKGKFSAATITLLLSSNYGSDCTRPPPFGQRIRIGGIFVSDREFFYQNFDLPIEEAATDTALKGYHDRTKELEAAAKPGGRAQRQAFAAHLVQYGEWHRAETVYQSLLNENDADLEALTQLAIIRMWLDEDLAAKVTLAELRRLAPPTKEWQGRIARTRYMLTGTFEPGWLDWSNLEWTRQCDPGHADLRGANFDGAVFPRGCFFEDAQLQGASFRGVDLRRVYLSNPNTGYPNLKGVKYNCATRFHPAIDPVAAGMINVEGRCLP